jgi:phosphate transport system substrate-binding protein
VLIDFGAVKQVGAISSDRGSRSDLTISIGTQGYAPSEQLIGTPQFSSDIYAAGMVAIRALTNVHPKLLRKNPQTHELQWQVEGVTICPELVAILDRMVRFDFRERYATAEEALAALWWEIPAELLKNSPELKIQAGAQSKPKAVHRSSAKVRHSQRSSREVSPAELPTLRQVFLRDFLPNIVRRRASFGGLAIVSLAILLATSVLSLRLGSPWANQHVTRNPAPGSTVEQGNSNPSVNQASQNSDTSSVADPEQEGSIALSESDGFANVGAVPSGLFNYGGSTTWVNIRQDVDPILQAARPGFRLRYTESVHGTPGSGSGIRMLMEGQLAFSQSSRPLKDEEYEQASLRGFSLKQIPVALDAIAFVVHPKLQVSSLTVKQIREIYTGKITNWSQVGGPDLTITPYSRRPTDGGTPDYFVTEVLDKVPLGSNVKYVYSTTDGIRKLEKDPGGIYYGSAVETVPKCTVKPLAIAHLHQPNKIVSPYKEPLVSPEDCPDRTNQVNAEAFRTGDYPVTRQLFVIIKQDGQLDQQAGEAYAALLLTNEGQELITKSGFVRIH